MKLDTTVFEEKMKKSIAVYKDELETIRAGRANASVLNGINVEYTAPPQP